MICIVLIILYKDNEEGHNAIKSEDELHSGDELLNEDDHSSVPSRNDDKSEDNNSNGSDNQDEGAEDIKGSVGDEELIKEKVEDSSYREDIQKGEGGDKEDASTPRDETHNNVITDNNSTKTNDSLEDKEKEKQEEVYGVNGRAGEVVNEEIEVEDEVVEKEEEKDYELVTHSETSMEEERHKEESTANNKHTVSPLSPSPSHSHSPPPSSSPTSTLPPPDSATTKTSSVAYDEDDDYFDDENYEKNAENSDAYLSLSLIFVFFSRLTQRKRAG